VIYYINSSEINSKIKSRYLPRYGSVQSIRGLLPTVAFLALLRDRRIPRAVTQGEIEALREAEGYRGFSP
jgi:hypothetical protein